MFKKSIIIIAIVYSFSAIAFDRSYFIDRQNGEMEKFAEDKTQITLAIKSQHTDNYLYEADSEDNTSSYQLLPTIKSQYHDDNQMFQLGVWAKHRKVNGYPEEDSTDTEGLVKYHYRIAHNQTLVGSAAFFDVYLDRGTDLSKGEAGSLDERDHQQSYFANIAHQLGHENSNAVLSTVLGTRRTEYKNRKEVNSVLNFDALYAISHFQFSLTEQSFLTTRFAFETLDYEFNGQQDRKVMSGLLGYKWKKNEFTTIELSLGALSINFDDGALSNKTDAKWDFKFNWAPTELIDVTLLSSRSVDENRQVDNSFIISDTYGVNLAYKLSERLQVYWQNSLNQLEYYLEDSNVNEDKLLSDLSMNYLFKENIALFASYRYQELDSKDPLVIYEKNEISVGVNFVF